MAFAFLVQLATGALMETGLAYQWFPNFGMLGFHMTFIYVLPTLILLHLVFMLLGKRRQLLAR